MSWTITVLKTSVAKFPAKSKTLYFHVYIHNVFIFIDPVSIFIFDVISQSISSVAVAQSSIYDVLVSIYCGFSHDKVMFGGVLSIIKDTQVSKFVHQLILQDSPVKIYIPSDFSELFSVTHVLFVSVSFSVIFSKFVKYIL